MSLKRQLIDAEQAGDDLLCNGRNWNRYVVANEFRKVCKAGSVVNKGFYTLRRTFETIATTADVPQAVIDCIMGHATNAMASVYRQKVFDSQLKNAQSTPSDGT